MSSATKMFFAAGSQDTPVSPVADSIVALWDFESAAQTADSAGANTLTEFETVPVATGKVGDGAGPFTSSNYFYGTSAVGPSGTSARTVSAWFKISGNTLTAGIIGNGGDASSLSSCTGMLVGVDATGRIGVYCGNGRTAFYGSGYNNGVWHYVTVTYDDSAFLSGVKVFCDGFELTQDALNNNAAIALEEQYNTSVGVWRRAVISSIFEGSMDQVLIADRLWTLADHNYARGAGAGRPTSELLGL